MEERKIKSLVAQLVEAQMKKLELKLRHFEELEQIMDKEREALEYQRQQLILERQSFHMDQLRYLENRAKHEAHNKMIAAGTLPAGLPLGFEVTGPPQPTPQVPVPPPQADEKDRAPSPASVVRAQTPGQVPTAPPQQQYPPQFGGQPGGYPPTARQQPPFNGPPHSGYQQYPPGQGTFFSRKY